MAGESILVVDDTPVNLKLTQLVLAGQGYSVETAASAEAALRALDRLHPELVLVDLQMPGMDGLEMTRRIKNDPRRKEILIVALTAFAMDCDREKAMAAGCDGYITKPIETRTLGAQVREILDRRKNSLKAAPAQPIASPGLILSDAELEDVQLRFLTEGAGQCQQFLDSLGGVFSKEQAEKSVHQWIGSAGLLGFGELTDKAKKLEEVLRDKPLEISVVRDRLTGLKFAFHARLNEKSLSVPEHIAQALNGRRIALIGFSSEYADRTCGPLESVGARPRLFPISEAPECDAIQECDLALIHVRPETRESPWLAEESTLRAVLVLTGAREDLFNLDHGVQKQSAEFLMDDWRPEELLMRLFCAFSRQATIPPNSGLVSDPEQYQKKTHPPTASARVVVADDDSLILTLVSRSLGNFGMTCLPAKDGPEALRLITEERPGVAILDVNMPELDGYEVLRGVRAAGLPVRVILLTARQREDDILKGFHLGADDYISKPFNVLELAARVKRLLQ